MELSERVEPVSVTGHVRCYRKRPRRVAMQTPSVGSRLLPRSGL